MFEHTFRLCQNNGLHSGDKGNLHLLTFKPTPSVPGQPGPWGEAPSDAAIQLGNLPPETAAKFTLGTAYRVTITPIEG